ncbi:MULTISPECIES: rhodanese-like domain-containing protein [Gracilibacillus]|uniref:hypothetical protein n=1 Tax=Gracilibacillus TaxID=74385 RepID=UPI000823F968|nr:MULTISPECIES: hypothetical protein [Gracilibacillus]
MIFIWLGILLLVVYGVSYLAYIRYVPVKGVPCLEKERVQRNQQTMVDIRDYHEAANDRVEEAMSIPLAYLGRYYKEIPTSTVHIIAANQLEKNLAIRLLKGKGLYVKGYTLTNCGCQKKLHNIA